MEPEEDVILTPDSPAVPLNYDSLRKYSSRKRSWISQFSSITIKNVKLTIRNWKTPFAILATPFFICLMLFGFQQLSDWVLGQSDPHPHPSVVGKIPRCISRNHVHCKTIRYLPDNVTWVTDLMQQLALDNDLDFDRDFEGLGQGLDATTNFELANNFFSSKKNQNTTQNMIVFYDTVSADQPFGMPHQQNSQSSLPTLFGYTIFYNMTDHDYNLEVLGSLQRILFKTHQQSNTNTTNNKNTNQTASISYKVADYPKPKLRVSGYDVVAAAGAFWFYVPPMIIFFICLTEIVLEKEKRLRIGMKMMGLTDSVYWISWMSYAAFFAALSAGFLVAFGSAFQFDFFLRTNPAVTFLLFFLFGLAVVSLSFFLTTLINSSSTAQTLGYSIVLIGFIFQVILASGYGTLIDLLYIENTPGWVVFIRWVFTFYPPYNMAHMFANIAKMSSNTIDIPKGEIVHGPGFTWGDLTHTQPVDSFFSLHFKLEPPVYSYIYLVANIAFYALLTWYFDNVLPGEHGSPKPFWFFVTPEYWGFGKKKPVALVQPLLNRASTNQDPEVDSDVEAEEHRLDKNEGSQSLLTVRHLSKIYAPLLFPSISSTVRAVDDISFSANRGEIFALLGHNGAGKTTTISMLTGLFSPSGGTCSVAGYDIIENIEEVRSRIGVCPQHDILWNELTALEHLRIFGAIKGLPRNEIEDQATSKLEQMGLLDVGNHLVGTFSGGMKRRLSVAIAAIGDPQVLFLDEPTTGMDPVNKRSVWQMIQDMKQDRTILLTTHSMEEADVLGDKVSVMAYGKLRCLGTGLHLKNKFGAGYRLSVVTRAEATFEVVQTLTSELPQLVLAANDAGSLTFTVPRALTSQMGHLLSMCEKLHRQGEITEFGVSHTTLEDVFITVSNKFNFSYKDSDATSEWSDNESTAKTESKITRDRSDTDRSSSALSLDSISEFDKAPLFGSAAQTPKSFSWKALVKKNFSLQKRQIGTNICQCVTPLFVLALLVLIQLIIAKELGSSASVTEFVQTLPIPLNPQGIPFPPFTNFSNTQDHCLEFFLFSQASGVDVGELDAQGNASGLLGQIRQGPCKLHNNTEIMKPYYLPRKDLWTMQEEIYQDFNQYNADPIRKVDDPPFSYLLPDGAVVFSKMEPGKELEFSLMVNDNSIVLYHRRNNFTRLDIDSSLLPKNLSGAAVKEELIVPIGQMALMDMINTAFAKLSFPDFPTIFVFAQPMPFYAHKSAYEILAAFGVFLFPIALSIQLPVYIYIMVMEKSDKLVEMMKMHGLKMGTYYLVNYLWNMFMLVGVIALFWLVGIAVQMRFFNETHWITLAVFFFGWTHALVGLSFLLAACIQSKRAATVIGYVVVLFGTLFGLAFAVSIYGIFPWSRREPLPWPYLMWPQFAFIRGIYLMNYDCGLFACAGNIFLMSPDDELVHVTIALYVDALVALVLGLYLDAVLPREWGIPKHPLFFISPLRSLFSRATQSRAASPAAPAQLPQDEESLLEQFANENEDIVAERLNVKKLDPATTPLIIRNLRKEFGEKVAVNDLSLSCKSGMCLGLLGENGAGKTTTISMLTGLYPPSSGTAYVAGWDIGQEIDQVHLRMGICPQFNILWDDLTVEEHLLFYARLKGIEGGHEAHHVKKCMQEVGLDKFADRLSKNLSGGMKRRLSVAVSLVGNSDIVFFDEPTTGLDPTSRRQLWKIIRRATKSRAVILTSHSMDEVELLCNQVAIMAYGRLRALGNQQHLKSQFAEGYNLKINFAEDDYTRAVKFVQDRLPNAVVTSKFRGSVAFKIPKSSHFNLGKTFETLEAEAQKSGITDWALQQQGLEEIFELIVNQSHKERKNHPDDDDEDSHLIN